MPRGDNHHHYYDTVAPEEEEEPVYENVASSEKEWERRRRRAENEEPRPPPRRKHRAHHGVRPAEAPTATTYGTSGDGGDARRGDRSRSHSRRRRKEKEEEEEEQREDRGCCRCTKEECCLWTRRVAVKLVLFLAVKIVAIELLRKGLKSLDECPAEPLIPIFLGVSAIDILLVGLLKMLQKCLHLPCWQENRHCGRCCSERCLTAGCLRILDGFVFIFVDVFQSVFSLIWIICGSVWVFSVYLPNFNRPRLPSYCRKDIYVFAMTFVCFAYLAVVIAAVLFVGRKVTGRRFVFWGSRRVAAEDEDAVEEEEHRRRRRRRQQSP